MIEKLEERMGSRAQTGHTALCRMRDAALRVLLSFYRLLCRKSHAPSSDLRRKDVVIAGNVDSCAAGRYDIEGVLACAGSRSWKDGGAQEVSVQGLDRMRLGDGADPPGRQRGNTFQDRKCVWHSSSLVLSVCFSLTTFSSLGVRVEKQDSCVGLG